MNTKIKHQWIDALLSEQYTQGKCYLRSWNNRYSVLGVLADIAVNKKLGSWSRFDCLDSLSPSPPTHPYQFLLDKSRMTEKDYGHAVFFLPNSILTSTNLGFSNALYLLQQNDFGLTFEQLAKEIELDFQNQKIVHLSKPASFCLV
jgi:hypothetical protein